MKGKTMVDIAFVVVGGTAWILSLALLLLIILDLREPTFGWLSYVNLSVGAILAGFITIVLLRESCRRGK